MKKAFTLLELMVVMCIIAILLGLVVTAQAGYTKLNRKQRAQASCAVVKQGIETYMAQNEGRWPGGNEPGFFDGYNSKESLSGSHVRSVVKALIMEYVNNGVQVMDFSKLHVSRVNGEKGTKGRAIEFNDAVRGTEENPKKMAVSEMYFGYPDPNTGYFRRFKITYAKQADDVEVTQL